MSARSKVAAPKRGTKQTFSPTFTGGRNVRIAVLPGSTPAELLHAAGCLANACVGALEGAANGGMDFVSRDGSLWLASYSMEMVQAMIHSAVEAIEGAHANDR